MEEVFDVGGELVFSFEFRQEEYTIDHLTPDCTCQDLINAISEEIHGVNDRGKSKEHFEYRVERTGHPGSVISGCSKTLKSIGILGGDIFLTIFVNSDAGSKSSEKIEIDTLKRDIVFRDHKQVPKVTGKCIIFGDKDEPCAKITECGCLISTAGMRGVIQFVLDKDGFSRIYCPICYQKKKKYIFWNYQKCLHIANLKKDVTTKIAKVFSHRYNERCGKFKRCPNCKILNRKAKNVTQYRINCASCKRDFCFRCSKSWKGKGMLVCGNKTCPTYLKQQRLLNCDVLKDEKEPNVKETKAEASTWSWFLPFGYSTDYVWKHERGNWIKRFPNRIPSFRACPACFALMEHRRRCPHMKCTSCGVDFCWICLTDKYHSHNSDSCKLAPRQTLE